MLSRTPPPVETEAQNVAPELFKWREGFILILLRLASIFGIFSIVISFPTSTVFARILFIGLYLVLLTVTLAKTSYTTKAYTLILTVFIVGMNAIIGWGPWADGNIFLLAALVLATLLLDQQLDFLFLGVSILSLTAMALLEQAGVYRAAPNLPRLTPADWAIYIIDFSVVGAILVAAISQFKGAFLQVSQSMSKSITTSETDKRNLEALARESREDLEARMEQIRLSSEAIRSISGIQNIAELLDTITRLVSEKFNFYHVSLFILDDQKKNAYLQAASSAAGAQLIGRAFRLAPDRKDPLMIVVNTNRPMLMTDIDQKTFLRDANFPLTRSRMLLPLSIHNEVIGLLDVHSDQPGAFDKADAEIMQTLADMAAISFDNVRLLSETRSLISQLEITNSIQTKRTWTKLTNRQKPAFQFTPAGVRPVFSPDKRVESGDMLIPLMLQGQKIGTIKLKRKTGSENWSDRDKVLVEKIADQVALALENSRLVEEAQRNAMQDQMIANISTQIRETLDIEAVIRTASSELRRVFDLKEAEIIVGAPPPEPLPKRNTSSLGRS